MNNKTIISVVVAVAVVVVLIVVGTRSKKDLSVVTPTPEVSASVSESPTVTPTKNPATPPVSGGGTLTYEDAITKYGKTRFQFDANCQASPTRIVIKKGTAVMLDNRGTVTRTIGVGTAKYTLAGRTFRVFVPTSSTFPANLPVSCGASQNVAQLLIER